MNTRPVWPAWALRLCAALLLTLAAVASGQAAPLTSIRSTPLPALPEAAPVRALLVLAGVPSAVTDGRVWTFNEAGKTWTPAALATPLPVLGSAGDGKLRGWLLLGASGAAEQVLALPAPGTAAPTLPALPQPLGAARAALLGESLFIAGIAGDGRPLLLQINPASPLPRWTVHAGW